MNYMKILKGGQSPGFLTTPCQDRDCVQSMTYSEPA